VLICDDAIFMRTMVGDILQQAGFEIVGEAETGVQAVGTATTSRPGDDGHVARHGRHDAVREITKQDPTARILMCMRGATALVEAIRPRKTSS
jgi:two-component system chemotaxis response regulator CheY